MDTAVILAGGLGTRLRSVVSDRPKPMANVGNRPFLQYLVDRLTSSGFSNIIICVSYMKDKIIDYFGRYDARIRFSVEEEPLGTAGALKNAENLLPEQFIVLNGDSFTPISYSELVSFHKKNDAKVTIALSRSNETRYGRVILEGNKISGFVEKGSTSSSDFVNAGVYAIEKGVLNYIPNGITYSLEKELFPELIKKSVFMLGFDSGVGFIDMGDPSSYAMLQRDPEVWLKQ